MVGGSGFDWGLGPGLISTQKMGRKVGFKTALGTWWDFLMLNKKLGEKEEKNYIVAIYESFQKKDPMHFYLSIYFFFKEIHAKGKRDRHGNHVLAAKHRKIIWHDLIFFFFVKRQSILPLNFTFLIRKPFDFKNITHG